MSRKTSFKEQMFRVLNSKNCFGQSKYQAKQESYLNGNNGKVSGIYSKKTMKDYKQIATQFNAWQKSKGYNFQSIKEITPTVITEYLLERQNDNYSAWTLSKDLSALNKIFNTSITKKDVGLCSRHSANIKNNRGLGNNYRNSVYTNPTNKEIIAFIQATGVRRQSLTTVSPSNAIYDTKGTVIGFSVIEKGGKFRNCYVRKDCQQTITDFVSQHSATKGNQPFWNKINKNLNTHWYRGDYAKGLYNDLLNAKNHGQDYFDGYRDKFINPTKLATATKNHKSTTKGYDTEVLAMVSQNLGHNRIDVIYTNYLGR